MTNLLSDIRHGGRLLRKNPGFAIVAVLVLALGIGANTAVFSLVNALLLSPIPSQRTGIVGVFVRDSTRPDSYREFSYQEYLQVRDAHEMFGSVMAHAATLAGITEGDNTRHVFVSLVTSNFFSTLGVTPTAGRAFTAEEEQPNSDIAVCIVPYEYARKAGLPPEKLLGTSIRVNMRDFTIVGVTPEGFTGMTAVFSQDVWLPLGVYASVTSDAFRGSSADLSKASTRALMVVGRLREGLRIDSADSLLATLSTRMRDSDPARNANLALSVHRLPRLAISDSPQSDGEIGGLSVLLMGMAALVLLVACLNVTNMLLARGAARRKEIALRLALGASRRRIVAQLLTENLVIAMAGAAAGLLLAVWGTSLLVSSLPLLPLALTFDAAPDVRVLGATLMFAVVSTIVAGLGPAWRITRPDVLPDLKEQTEAGAPGRLRTRHLLVLGQLALSLALLITAGLFIRGAAKAAVADPGFAVDGELLAVIDPSLAGFDETRGRAALGAILQRVRSTPGVHSASIASIVPFGNEHQTALVQHAGTPPAPEGQRDAGVSATYIVVGADYFETVRVPVLRGRAFNAAEEDAAGGPAVAIIDEPAASQLFGQDDPIGRDIQLRRGQGTPQVMHVIGVVRGFRQQLLDRVPGPHVFVPSGRTYRAAMNLHVRLAASGENAENAMLQTIRQQIRAANDRVPITSLKSLRQHRDDGILLWAANTGARLFTAFGGVALLLAVVGVYGVKSYVVSRRTREIGIRMALGALPRDVVWLVMRESLWLTAVGIGAGLLTGALAAKLVSGMLYQVSALDPLVFGIAAGLLTFSALIASYLPARRATRVVPTIALRDQ